MHTQHTHTHTHTHTATHRRTIRKVQPESKLDLIKAYKQSVESRFINKQLEHTHFETRRSPGMRCENYFSYHLKRIPYYVTSFFLQVCVCVCVCVCVSSHLISLLMCPSNPPSVPLPVHSLHKHKLA